MQIRIPFWSMDRTHLRVYVIKPLSHPLCPRHRYHERPGHTSISDHVLRTEHGSPTFTDRHAMSIILPQPTRWPGFKKDWLVQVPGITVSWAPVQTWSPEWGGYWRLWQGAVKRYLESVDRIHSQVSPTRWPMATIPACIQDEIAWKPG